MIELTNSVPNSVVYHVLEVQSADLFIVLFSELSTEIIHTLFAMLFDLVYVPQTEGSEILLHVDATRADFVEVSCQVIENREFLLSSHYE